MDNIGVNKVTKPSELYILTKQKLEEGINIKTLDEALHAQGFKIVLIPGSEDFTIEKI